MIVTMRPAAPEAVVQYVVRHARSLAITPAEFAELLRDIDAIGGAMGRGEPERGAGAEQGRVAAATYNVTGQRTSGCGR